MKGKMCEKGQEPLSYYIYLKRSHETCAYETRIQSVKRVVVYSLCGLYVLKEAPDAPQKPQERRK